MRNILLEFFPSFFLSNWKVFPPALIFEICDVRFVLFLSQIFERIHSETTWAWSSPCGKVFDN